jgi:Flp pilus assembly protein TadD
MRRVFIILLATAFVFSNIGCGPNSENSNNQNTNVGPPTATPTAETNQNTNANMATATKDEPVPTFTDANTAFTEGNKYFDQNENEKAIEAFRQAVKLNPDLAEAHFKLGVAYALIEKEKQAETEVADPQPTKTPKKGKEVTKKKDSEKAFEEAVKAYKKIVAKNPTDDVAFYNLGRSYNKINEDKEAEKAFRQAVKLKPEDSEYQTGLGEILVKFAKYEEALGVLKKALALDSSNSQAQDLMEKAEAGKKRLEYGQPKDKPKDKPKAPSKDKPKDNTNSAEPVEEKTPIP